MKKEYTAGTPEHELLRIIFTYYYVGLICYLLHCRYSEAIGHLRVNIMLFDDFKFK